MPTSFLPPRYKFPSAMPSMLQMVRDAPTDALGLMPDSLLDAKIMAMPAPGAPVVICDPEIVEKVLFDDGTLWDRNVQVKRFIRRAWGEGLAASTGDAWLRQRRAVAPAFRAQTLGDYVPEMRRAAEDAQASWLSHDGPLDLAPATGRVVSQIVLNTLITGHTDADYAQLADDIPALFRKITKFGMLDMLPLPEALIDRFRGIPSSPARKRLMAFAETLAAHREHSPDAVQDIPALIRGHGALADNIFGFMSASFETTAIGAAWTLYLLALYPDWQTRLRDEATTAEGLAGNAHIDALPLMRKVVRESLRLYPPAPFTARAAMKKTELLGHRFVKDQVALIGVYPMHRSRSLWDEPDAFNPDRAAPAHRAAYIPFSAGPRMCTAAAFTEVEIMVLVSELLRHVSLEPAAPEPVISLSVSTHSRTGINVSVKPV